MEEKEIDLVIADDLAPGDIINVNPTGFVTVVKRLEDSHDGLLGDLVNVLADDEEEYSFKWDSMVTLYGY
jgi:hypothetical protein